MGFEIITLTPLWFSLICVALAAGLTWLLYRKHFFESNALVWVMRVLRFLGLFLVFVLLLSPIIRLKVQKEIKPGLAIFLDKSKSISDTVKNAFAQKVRSAAEKLNDKYNVQVYSFGGSVGALNDSNIASNSTSIASVFDYTNEILEGKNITDLVIISDGIQNSGLNPLFKKLAKPARVHAFGLGDTVQYPDVWVSAMDANSTVFFENEFTIETGIRCAGIQASNIVAELWADGQKIQTQTWTRTGNFGRLSFVVKPNSVGLKHYEIKIPAVQGESNLVNNNKSIWVQVTDTRRKVALIAHAANPDIAAIARALETNVQYEISRFESRNMPPIAAYDIFVCHGFPTSQDELKYLRDLQAAKKAFWVIFTTQTNPGFIKSNEFGLDPATASGVNNAQAYYNSNFSEFLSDNAFEADVKNWPPLLSPYGRYRTGPGFKTLLFQKIGAVNTEMPLMGFTSNNSSRQAWLMGEGIWKWRLKDYEITREHKNFDGLISKTMQYLGAAEVKQKFSVFMEKPGVNRQENVTIFAEYLNQSGELDNHLDCELQVSSSSGFSKSLKFAKNGRRYRADLGQLPAGDYKFKASVLGGARETANGTFSVTDQLVELENTVADHGLLRKLATSHDGLFFNSEQWDQLLAQLQNTKQVSNLLTQEVKVTELIHWKWFFALIILLFGAEWFLRKREGGY